MLLPTRREELPVRRSNRIGSISTRRDHLQFEFVLCDVTRRDATLKRLHIVNPALDAAQCSKGLIIL